MNFSKDGKFFVHVKYNGKTRIGTLCFKLVEDTNQYVVGWSTLVKQDIPKFCKATGREIAEERADAFVEQYLKTDVLDFEAYKNMYSDTLVFMLEEINKIAVKLKEKGYTPVDVTLAPETEYTPYGIKDFVQRYYLEDVYGIDGFKYKLAFANTINGMGLAFVRVEGVPKTFPFYNTAHCMYYFVDEDGCPLGK